MNFTGVIANAVLVLVGGALGMIFGDKIPKKIRDVIYTALALCVLYIGIGNSTDEGNIIVSILAMAIGGALGEWLDIDGKLSILGDKVKAKLSKADDNFSEGFVTSTLLFCMGAMSILGSIESGILGDATTLMAKSFLDGMIAIVLATTYGFGVLAAAVPVLVYQLALTLLAGLISPYLTDAVVFQISFTGGILLIAIGLNMLGLTKIKIGNFVLTPFICIPLMFVPFLTNL